MEELAIKIDQDLTGLANSFQRRLADLPGFAEMGSAEQMAIACGTLEQLRNALRTGDLVGFGQHVAHQTSEWLLLGLSYEPLLRFVSVLEEVTRPLADNLESAGLLWSTLSWIRDMIIQRISNATPTYAAGLGELIDRSLVGVFRCTLEGAVVEANPALLRALRLDSIEHANQVGFPNLYADPADRQRLLELVRRGPAWNFEVRFRRGDGEIIWVSLDAFLVLTEDGTPEFLEGTLTDITGQKALEQQLGQISDRRGLQVQTSAEIARLVATTPALDDLYKSVVTLVKERFGYYHAQIFRHDPTRDAVVLIAGYGATGKRMFAARHQIEMGRGVVGTAAMTGQAVLASDTTQDPDWLPNPNLPDTKGELAVPIIQQPDGAVLGILDVQSDTAAALTNEDQLMLEGLCDQIAVAIQNTRLRLEMEEQIRELDTLHRTMSRQGWDELQDTADMQTGVVYDRMGLKAATDLWTPEVRLAAQEKTLVRPFRDGDHTPAAVVPFTPHGEVVGALGVIENDENPLTEEELILIESVSEQVALALESSRLFGETQQALTDAELLYAVSMRLAEATTLQEVVNAAAESLSIPGVNHAILWLLERDIGGQPKVLRSAANWHAADSAAPFPDGTTFALADFPSLRMALSEDATFVGDLQETEQLDPATADAFHQQEALSLAVLPLWIASRQLGALMLVGNTAHRYAERERRLLRSLANQMTVVMENQRLLLEAQNRAEQLNILNQLANATSESLEMDLMLQTGLDAVSKLTGFEIGLVSLMSPESGRLEVTLESNLPEPLLIKLQQDGLEDTLCDYVYQRGEILALGSLDEYAPVDVQGALALGLRSYVGAPIAHRGEALGTLCLFSRQEQPVSGIDQELLQAVGNQMGVGVANALLLQQTQAALAEAEAAYNRYLSQQWQSFLGTATNRAWGYVEGPAGLVQEETLWTPEIEQAVETQSVSTITEWAGAESQKEILRSGLAIPITLGGQTIGVMDLYQEGGGRAWSQDDRLLVQAVANQIAQALESARLFEQTQRRATRERLTSELTGKIHAAGDIDTVLSTAAEELGRILGASRSLIRLQSEDEAGSKDGNGIHAQASSGQARS